MNNELIQTLTQIYKKNISYLKSEHQNIFEKISSFEKKSVENYFIDFIDGSFELTDGKGKRYYNCDPFYDAKYRAENINSSISGIKTIHTSPLSPNKEHSFDAKLFLNQYIDLIKKKEIDENNLFYDKFIFIGTLLGVHLNDINKKIKAKSYLITERSIEIFRLSLFLTDYTDLAANSKLFFAIEENETNLEKIIKEFLLYRYESNAFIKYEVASDSHIELLESCTNIISGQSKLVYPYSEFLENYICSMRNIKKLKTGILNISVPGRVFYDYPIMFIASGPSLGENINFIKNNKNRFLIISVLSSLKRLEKEDIIPDIIISIDGNKTVENSLPNNEKYYKNSLIIASISTHYDVFEKLNNDNCFLIQTHLSLFEKLGCVQGVSVGDSAIDIIKKLGFKTIYLNGFDAALDQDSGSTNDNLHAYNIQKDLEITNILREDNIDYVNKVLNVKGNFKDEVVTTLYYKMIIDSFNDITRDLRDKQIYNLSNGAYLNNSIPLDYNKLNLSKYEILNKNFIQEEIKKILLKSSKSSFSKEDKDSLELEYTIASDFEHYKKNKKILKSSILGQIIIEYKYLVEPYISYLKNNSNIQAKVLDNLQKKQINIILDNFKSASFKP